LELSNQKNINHLKNLAWHLYKYLYYISYLRNSLSEAYINRTSNSLSYWKWSNVQKDIDSHGNHGKLEHATSYKIGALAKYRCERGYKIKGSPFSENLCLSARRMESRVVKYHNASISISKYLILFIEKYILPNQLFILYRYNRWIVDYL